jgi:class 3 adenylate cyclase
VRRLRFHDPDTLSAWEYAIYCRGSPVGLMDDGTPWLEVIKSSLRAITWLMPGTSEQLAIDVGENLLIGFDMLTDANFAFVASGAPASAPQHVPLVVRAGTCEPAQGTLAPGRAVFELQSRSDRRSLFGVLAFPLDLPKNVTLHFVPFLSGARLLASQTFRDCFRSEVIRATEGIAVRNVTLLFTDLKGSTALYERIGDLNAYMMVQRHFDHLQAVTARHQGAVTKTIGDAVMAAFLSPANAVEAAIEMREAVEQLNRDRPQRDFVLKIGLHNGAAIAVTLNDRLDYFGQTVNIAARVQALADGDEIWMTEQVHDAPGVAGILAPLAVEPTAAELKGVEGAVAVYRVRGTAEDGRRPS